MRFWKRKNEGLKGEEILLTGEPPRVDPAYAYAFFYIVEMAERGEREWTLRSSEPLPSLKRFEGQLPFFPDVAAHMREQAGIAADFDEGTFEMSVAGRGVDVHVRDRVSGDNRTIQVHMQYQ